MTGGSQKTVPAAPDIPCTDWCKVLCNSHMGSLHPGPQPSRHGVCRLYGYEIAASDDLTGQKGHIYGSQCFSIREYRASALFHNWDQKPISTFWEPCFCHKSHPNPASSTCTVSRNGRAGSTSNAVSNGWGWLAGEHVELWEQAPHCTEQVRSVPNHIVGWLLPDMCANISKVWWDG